MLKITTILLFILSTVASFAKDGTKDQNEQEINNLINATPVNPDSPGMHNQHSTNALRDSLLLNMSRHSPDSATAYMNAYLHYKKEIYWQARQALKDRTETYAWQHRTSHWIFYIVIFIVIIGICFSAAHFYNAIRRENKLLAMQMAHPVKEKKDSKATAKTTPAAGDDGTADTEIEVSTSGIKISSSLVGIIVLFFSLLFFLLYLKFVYPVNETSLDNIKVNDINVENPAE